MYLVFTRALPDLISMLASMSERISRLRESSPGCGQSGNRGLDEPQGTRAAYTHEAELIEERRIVMT